MARSPKPPAGPRPIETLVYADTRRNIPTAEFQSLAQQMEEVAPFQPARYKRTATLTKGEIRERNADLDPQIVWRGMRITLTEAQRKQLQETGEVELGDARLAWRGKDTQDWSDLVVNPPPMYIQEKVQPKAIIEGIRKEARARAEATADVPDLFSDFNGLDDPEARLEFYQHDQHWSNRMILGDSLQVMASLAEREGMRGKVQCIYIDPPYGIRFNSNWQVSTQDRNVEDGRRKDLTREPEQVKAFRDTWKDGIQSYLTYLRDRLTVARELLADGGSIFVQIGDQNVHRVRAVMDEVFREDNFVSSITFKKTTGSTSTGISNVADEILWFAKEIKSFVPYTLYIPQAAGEEEAKEYRRVELPSRNIEPVNKFRVDGKIQLPEGGRLLTTGDITSKGGDDRDVEVTHQGKTIVLLCKPNRHWKAGGVEGMKRLWLADRLLKQRGLRIYKRYFDDFPYLALNNIWNDTRGESDSVYVVQTSELVVQRCILMATKPGDIVLDPTCGSGTTANVAEQWGRRWITIDTSRLALALARTRLMASNFPYYLLADSPEGRAKEGEVSGKVLLEIPTQNDVRQGFVYYRAAHITPESNANNLEIDVLWEEAQRNLDAIRGRLNGALGSTWEEWQIPRHPDTKCSADVTKTHAAWWEARSERQKRIDASIARRADIEYLYDRPYEDKSRIRVAGPFTVESLSPHRVVPADEDGWAGNFNGNEWETYVNPPATTGTWYAWAIGYSGANGAGTVLFSIVGAAVAAS